MKASFPTKIHKLNLALLTKRQLVHRLNFQCVHRHNGLDHPGCYLSVMDGQDERIAFFDIETSHLKASIGYMITYCIKPLGGKVIKRSVTTEEIQKGIYDKNLCKRLMRDFEQFDRIIGHYSVRFDIPFVRTRCVLWGIEFPEYMRKRQSDTWFILRYRFQLHSNRLETACQFFGIEAKTHPLNGRVWQDAMVGKKKALRYIMTHNVEDVVSLEKLWLKINEHAPKGNRSL